MPKSLTTTERQMIEPLCQLVNQNDRLEALGWGWWAFFGDCNVTVKDNDAISFHFESIS